MTDCICPPNRYSTVCPLHYNVYIPSDQSPRGPVVTDQDIEITIAQFNDDPAFRMTGHSPDSPRARSAAYYNTPPAFSNLQYQSQQTTSTYAGPTAPTTYWSQPYNGGAIYNSATNIPSRHPQPYGSLTRATQAQQAALPQYATYPSGQAVTREPRDAVYSTGTTSPPQSRFNTASSSLVANGSSGSSSENSRRSSRQAAVNGVLLPQRPTQTECDANGIEPARTESPMSYMSLSSDSQVTPSSGSSQRRRQHRSRR